MQQIFCKSYPSGKIFSLGNFWCQKNIWLNLWSLLTNYHPQLQPKMTKQPFGDPNYLVPGNFLIDCFQFLKKLNLVPGKIKSYQHCLRATKVKCHSYQSSHSLWFNIRSWLHLPSLSLHVSTKHDSIALISSRFLQVSLPEAIIK